MGNFSLIEWDSAFFGYKIALLQFSQDSVNVLEQTICKLKSKDFKLAYCFIDPKDIISNEAMLKLSGLLVDEKITYSYSIGQLRKYPIDKQVRIYSGNIVPGELVTLTLQSGVHSRFRIDPNFQNNEYENLYKEWIKKSVTKELADQVLVYEEEGQILGFITLKIKKEHGSIGLLAVDEHFRGKSIGRKLLSSSFAYFHANNVTRVEVVTQRENYIACRFYEACGFNVSEIVNVYHLWIK